jgi:hypothetical protein
LGCRIATRLCHIHRRIVAVSCRAKGYDDLKVSLLVPDGSTHATFEARPQRHPVVEFLDAGKSALSELPFGLYPDPLRKRGEADHRVRKGSIFGTVEVEYPPKSSAARRTRSASTYRSSSCAPRPERWEA